MMFLKIDRLAELPLANSTWRLRVNDSWIAALAIQHKMPVVTQDADFDAKPK